MKLKAAVCHEWITTYGGSEQVAAALAEAVNASDIFAFTVRPELAEDLFGGRPVHVAGRLGGTRFARDHWKWLLPVMARDWRRLDLGSFDLVMTSSHACVNSIRVRPGALHISYCHTPMRYAWEWREESRRVPSGARWIWPLLARSLRRGDAERAKNVHVFIANSRHVADRISAYYDRDAFVVHPPIDTDFWSPAVEPQNREHFLVAGRMVAYKRPDLAVLAANEAAVPMVVAGDGPEMSRLQRIAGPTVTFVRSPKAEHLRDLYRSARALVFPGKEDFGMTMVEAQSCGTPVIALGRGGAREAVVDGVTGLLYEPGDPLPEILQRFDPALYEQGSLLEHAARFSPSRFRESIQAIVERALHSHGAGGHL